jgi:acetylserotonin N-methyltransferase
MLELDTQSYSNFNWQAEVPSDELAHKLWLDQYTIAVIVAAKQLGLFDYLYESGPTSIEKLANILKAHPVSLDRALIILHCKKLIHYSSSEPIVSLTEQGRLYWCKKSFLYRGYFFDTKHLEDKEHEYSYQYLRVLKMLKEGGAPVITSQGSINEMWDKETVDKKIATHYNNFMRSISFPLGLALAKCSFFKSVKNYTDLGGGSGGLSMAIKGAYPSIHCRILDLPGICSATKDYLKNYPYEIEVVPFSFFEPIWPFRSDCMSLCNILHDWQPEKCIEILSNVRRNLVPGGSLIVIESLLNSDLRGPEDAAVLHLLMWMNHSAQHFSLMNMKEMFRKAGFKTVNQIGACGSYTFIQAQ